MESAGMYGAALQRPRSERAVCSPRLDGWASGGTTDYPQTSGGLRTVQGPDEKTYIPGDIPGKITMEDGCPPLASVNTPGMRCNPTEEDY